MLFQSKRDHQGVRLIEDLFQADRFEHKRPAHGLRGDLRAGRHEPEATNAPVLRAERRDLGGASVAFVLPVLRGDGRALTDQHLPVARQEVRPVQVLSGADLHEPCGQGETDGGLRSGLR